MLKIILLLSNQLHCLDSNCILVGRSGTGKLTILRVVASLNRMLIWENKYDVSEAVVRALRGECVVLLEGFVRREFRGLL